MKIRYETSIKDIVAFGRNVCQHSPTIRRKIMMVRILNGALALAGLAAMAFVLESSFPLFFAIVGVPIAAILGSKLFENAVENNFRKIYSEEENKRLLGPCELELTESALIAKNSLGEGRVLLDAIFKVVSDERRTFIYIGSANAFVIPKASVTEGDYDAFVEAVRQRVDERRDIDR